MLVTNRLSLPGHRSLGRPGLGRRHRTRRTRRRQPARTPERPRCRHAQLRQRRHRGRGEGGERNHREELRSRSARQGHGQYRLGQADVEGAGLPGVSVGDAPAGIYRGRGPRHGHDRPRDRSQGACERHAGTGARQGRYHPDAGVQAATRIGGANGDGVAPADRAQQQHHRLHWQQQPGDYGLCEQPAAHRKNHRIDRPADRFRFDHDSAAVRLCARRGADHHPLGHRAGAGGGSDQPFFDRRGCALEQRARSRRRSVALEARAPTGGDARFAHQRQRQYSCDLSEERPGGEAGGDTARDLQRQFRDHADASERDYECAAAGAGAGAGAGERVYARHYSGGCGDQLDHHHRSRCDLQQSARRGGEARRAPRAGVCRGADCRGHGRQGGRVRHPVAEPERARQIQYAGLRRHQFRHRRPEHRLDFAESGGSRARFECRRGAGHDHHPGRGRRGSESRPAGARAPGRRQCQHPVDPDAADPR